MCKDRLCKIASRTTVNVIKAALQQIVSSWMVKIKKGFNTALSTCRFVIYSANKENLSKTTGLPEDTSIYTVAYTITTDNVRCKADGEAGTGECWILMTIKRTCNVNKLIDMEGFYTCMVQSNIIHYPHYRNVENTMNKKTTQ